ncbi:16228_t:CDS:2 [Funneliformis geosporum]|nr:16228_t:CDS:2 [Funneliformis geosporum]
MKKKLPITERSLTKKARQDNNNNKTTENEQQISSQNNIPPPVPIETETIDSVASSSNNKGKNPKITFSSVSTNTFNEDQAFDASENMLGNNNDQTNVFSFK